MQLSHLLPRQLGSTIGNAISDFGSTLSSALGLDQRQQSSSPAVVTVVVMTTASPTFTGAIGGYSTPGTGSATVAAPVAASSSKIPAKVITSSSVSKVASSILVDTSKQKSTTASRTTSAASSSTGLPSKIIASSVSLSSSAPILAASNTPAAVTASTAPLTTTEAETSSSSSGMTTAGKAGVAVGVVLGIGVLISLVVFFLYRRRIAAQRERLDDEKVFGTDKPLPIPAPMRAPSNRTAKTSSTAPRLSLRPVTQFLPMLGGNSNNNQNGNVMAMTPTNARYDQQGRQLTPQSAWERPMTSDSQNRANPFGNHAETVDPVNAAGPPVVRDLTPNGELVAAGAAGAAAGVAAGAVVGAAVPLKRGASKRGPGSKPMDFTQTLPGLPPPGMGPPPSPAGTEFSENASDTPGAPVQSRGAAAIAAAGGPPNSTVHRVQLDFNPSMEDELQIRAGQLIRLLHEYDDGWALCIRLDRSEQGVVPRTCLSTRPVKPRPRQPGPPNGPNGPNGPPRGPPQGMRGPPGPQGRPASPAFQGQRGPPGRPMTPTGRPMTPTGRPMTPTGGPMTPTGRPMTPNGPRPMTPTGARSGSPGPGHMRRNSPPGPSAMNPNAQSGSPPRGIDRRPVAQ